MGNDRVRQPRLSGERRPIDSEVTTHALQLGALLHKSQHVMDHIAAFVF